MKRFILCIATALVLSSSAFSKDIKGRVLDEKGTPLEFVNAFLLQDSVFITGVISNSNGEFQLSSDLITGMQLQLSMIQKS